MKAPTQDQGLFRSFGPVHVLALLSLGALGWGAIAAATLEPPGWFRPWEFSWALWLTVAMAGASRFLSVRLYEGVRIALDSAFYVSSAFVFGIVPAAWMALLVLTVDGVVGIARGVAPAERRFAPRSYLGPYLLYHGGLPALALLGVGTLFGVDAYPSLADTTLYWLLPSFGLAFLATHYALAGGMLWLFGLSDGSLWRRFVVRVVLAEASLLPLALAMVLSYRHQGIVLTGLLGATCLFFNAVFRRATVATGKLERRVVELSTLNKVGRIISSSLERRTLLRNIARETLSLVQQSSGFMLGTQNADGTADYELFDSDGHNYKQMHAPSDDGLSGWVMRHRRALLLRDVPREYGRYSKTDIYFDPKVRSWLGVPLVAYDEVVGVMSVQSEQGAAYTRDQMRVMMSIADQAAVALDNARLYELATVDGLTGLLVRRHFDQRLHEEWNRSQRYETPFALGIFDLDNFKQLNDTYGHQAGDQVLRAAAKVVSANMRTVDLAGRYGGEEFAFLLPRTDLRWATKVAERIRADIESMPVRIEGREIFVSASIGVASVPDSGARSVAELVGIADAAMYRAKRLGKNRVEAAKEASRRAG